MAYVCPSCKERVTYNEGKPCIYCDKVSKTTFGKHGLDIDRKSSPRYGLPWTEKDETELMNLEARYSLQQLSILFTRSKSAIEDKMRKLKKTVKREIYKCPRCYRENDKGRGNCLACGYNGHVYVLKLSEEKYYVGWSSKVGIRIEQHFTGKGSPWTKKYRPSELIYVKKGNKNWEKEMIKEMSRKYGRNNVGGS